jgi:hypothetical protein
MFGHAEGRSVAFCEFQSRWEEQSNVEDGRKRVPSRLGENAATRSDMSLLDRPRNSPTLNTSLLWRTSLTHHLSHFDGKDVFRISEIERGSDIDVPGHEVCMNEFTCGGDALRRPSAGASA